MKSVRFKRQHQSGNSVRKPSFPAARPSAQYFGGADVGQTVITGERQNIDFYSRKFVGDRFGLRHGKSQIGKRDALALVAEIGGKGEKISISPAPSFTRITPSISSWSFGRYFCDLANANSVCTEFRRLLPCARQTRPGHAATCQFLVPSPCRYCYGTGSQTFPDRSANAGDTPRSSHHSS